MNKWIGCGRLTRDPDVRYSQDKKAIAKFTLAVDRRFSKENATDFISCVAFGNTAEFAEKYLHKGIKVLVEGRWQTGSYENKEGQKVYTNDCFVEAIEFTESKKDDKNDGFVSVPEGLEEDLPFN